MKKFKDKFNTNAIREGIKRTPEGEHSEAMFLTSSFVFKNAQELQIDLKIREMVIMSIHALQIPR